jgi:hypothetical protein
MSLRKRRRAEKKPVPDLDAKLRASMHRLSARDAMFIGHALAQSRQARGQTLEQQAAALNLSEAVLAMLAMCKAPRPDQRAADLAAVAAHVGLNVDVLDALLLEAEKLGTGA